MSCSSVYLIVIMFINGFFQAERKKLCEWCHYLWIDFESGFYSCAGTQPFHSIIFTSYSAVFFLNLIVQGIELCNPQQALGLGSGTQSTYFSESGTFSKLKK